MKYLLLILIVSVVLCLMWINYQTKQIGTLKAEKKQLSEVIDNERKASIRASEQIRQLQRQIQDNKEALDWSRSSVPNDIREFLLNLE